MCFKRRKVKKKRGGSQRFQKGEKPKILIYIQKLSKFQSYSKRNTTLENRNRHRGGGNPSQAWLTVCLKNAVTAGRNLSESRVDMNKQCH